MNNSILHNNKDLGTSHWIKKYAKKYLKSCTTAMNEASQILIMQLLSQSKISIVYSEMKYIISS
jgi:hypothetical protein